MICSENEYLVKLEKSKKWNDAIELLYNQWAEDKNNISKTFRIISECWFILVNYSLFNLNDDILSYKKTLRTLIETTNFGIKHFYIDSMFLCFVGYMMAMFPYLFYERQSSILFHKTEENGKKMIGQAIFLDNNNSIAKEFLCGFNESNNKHSYEVNEDAQKMMKMIFCGDSLIEKYFKNILKNQ